MTRTRIGRASNGLPRSPAGTLANAQNKRFKQLGPRRPRSRLFSPRCHPRRAFLKWRRIEADFRCQPGKPSRGAMGQGTSGARGGSCWWLRGWSTAPVAASGSSRARLGTWITPTTGGYSGPSHSHCNRARRSGARNGRPVVNLDDYQDDPARGIYWGPPGLNGEPMRWSRPWFEWRNDPTLLIPDWAG